MKLYQKLRRGHWHEGELRNERAKLKEHHRRESKEDNPSLAEIDREIEAEQYNRCGCDQCSYERSGY